MAGISALQTSKATVSVLSHCHKDKALRYEVRYEDVKNSVKTNRWIWPINQKTKNGLRASKLVELPVMVWRPNMNRCATDAWWVTKKILLIEVRITRNLDLHHSSALLRWNNPLTLLHRSKSDKSTYVRKLKIKSYAVTRGMYLWNS